MLRPLHGRPDRVRVQAPEAEGFQGGQSNFPVDYAARMRHDVFGGQLRL